MIKEKLGFTTISNNHKVNLILHKNKFKPLTRVNVFSILNLETINQRGNK